jgi:succinoglycan biosynthesis transport protein ExoP
MTAVPQSQINISRRALDIEDYIDIARRHVSWIIGPLYAGIAISTIIAFFLSNVYVSRAALRITPSQIPENLIPATFNQQMSDRITAMWQDVTSRSSLSELIQRPSLDLYKAERNRKPLEDVIEEMKSRDISLAILGLQSSAGKPNSAFTISYSYPDRFKAQAVVSALVTKLTDANTAAQRTIVNSTNDLMTDEEKAAKETLDKLDQELTAFKMANQGRLPEQLQINMSAMNTLGQQLGGDNDALSRNAAQKLMTEQQLLSLNAQKAQLENMAYATPEETAMNTAAAAKNEELAQMNHEIRQNEAQLAVLKKTYTAKHPDLIDFENRLDVLRQRRDQLIKDDAAAAAAEKAAEAKKPKAAPPKRTIKFQDQQSLQQIQASIDATKTQLTVLELERVRLQKDQDSINSRLAAFQARIEASPINEQKYMAMMRDRAIAAQRYEELEHKQQLTKQGIEINNRKAGETLDLLDPASLPETPTAPNRWQIVMMGAFAGLMAGFAMAGAKEMKDTSLKNLKDVRAYTNLPVLSSIPLLENALLVRRKRRLAYVGWAVAVIIGLCGTAISLYYHFQISAK